MIRMVFRNYFVDSVHSVQIVWQKRLSRRSSNVPVRRRTLLAKYIVFHDRDDGAETIVPADLLSLLIGASVVGDSHFVNPGSGVGDLGYDFRIKGEPVLLKRDGSKKIAPEDL